MRNYYAIVNVENRRLGTYVSAENIGAAFEAAKFKCKTRYPRLHVETIAVQEIADRYADQDTSQFKRTTPEARSTMLVIPLR